LQGLREFESHSIRQRLSQHQKIRVTEAKTSYLISHSIVVNSISVLNKEVDVRSREFREHLLVAIYQSASKGNLANYLSPREIADQFSLERRPGQLRLAVDDLDGRGYVEASKSLGGGDEGGLHLRLTNSGVEAAEELLDENPDYGFPAKRHLPAADRYVALNDNQRGYVQGDLHTLRSAIQSSNEADEEDRQIALSEIAVFEAALIQPRLSTELIERFTKRIIGWIVSKFGEAIVGAVAESLVAKLLPFLA
jgi:DNA-binding MarR family transcriptional regulator